MSIKIATKQDVHKWNKIVEKDPQGKFFDRFEWCQGLGLISNNIKPFPLFIEDNGGVIRVFPLCIVKYSFALANVRTFESLPFSDYGGGSFFRSREILEFPKFLEQFINNLIKIGSKNRCLRISIRRTYFPDIINSNIIRKPLITDTSKCTFLIFLTEGIDEIYRKMRSSRRRSIKQGEKRGIMIHEAQDLYDLQSFYKIYSRTMTQKRTTPLPYHLFHYIWDVFIPRNEAKIFVANYYNKPVGGILIFIYNGICHAWAWGSLKEYNDKRPIDLLLWHSIKWSFENNLKIFDLGNTDNDPSSGNYFFKRSWGGKKMALYTYHIILQPNKWKLYRFGNKIVSIIKNNFY